MSELSPSPIEAVDNDELTAFVSSTLRAIAAGVDEAARNTRVDKERGYTQFEMPPKVVFDVAVTAKRTAGTSKGLKVEVFNVGGGLEGKKSTDHETVSRIQFEVPWQHTSTYKPDMSKIGKQLA